jgi:hypothetical protein
LPEYLYDNNPFNDISYLMNLSVLYNYSFKSVGMSLTGNTNRPILRGDTWSNRDKFGKEAVMKVQDKNQKKQKSKGELYYQENVVSNLEELIIPMVQSNPDTEFCFFFPPKCITYWSNAKMDGEFDAKFYSLEYVVSLLLTEPNVKVYYYQDNMEWVTDFSLYKDNIHFKQTVNNQMAEKMTDGDGELTKENYKTIIDGFKNKLMYDSLYSFRN